MPSSSGCLREAVVKWHKPPVWPVAIPAFVGFVLAVIATAMAGLMQGLGVPFLRFGWLMMLGAAIPFGAARDPADESDARFGDQFAGVLMALVLGYWPQLVIPPWVVFVFLAWILQSTYLWKRDYPPFRFGVWLGLGLMSGFWGGAILAGLVLL